MTEALGGKGDIGSEQGNEMLCCSGEGGRKPPWIMESRLVVQRASPATQSARSAGAPPPSVRLLIHDLLHPFSLRLPRM